MASRSFPGFVQLNAMQEFARMDPAMGRGYRIGDQKIIPTGGAPVTLVEHGEAHKIRRWKVSLYVTDHGGNQPPLTGAGLRFVVMAKMENERIPRQCFVSVGDAQVVYAPGRSIQIQATNPNAFALTAHYGLDEYTAGLSVWEDQEVFSPGAAAAAARLRGYGPGGTLVYDETLATPRSGEIERIPNIAYTLSPTAAPQAHVILYRCNG